MGLRTSLVRSSSDKVALAGFACGWDRDPANGLDVWSIFGIVAKDSVGVEDLLSFFMDFLRYPEDC